MSRATAPKPAAPAAPDLKDGATLGGLFATAGNHASARARQERRQVPPSGAESIQERFEAFHRDHPEVWAEFERLALILLDKHRRGLVKWISAKHVFEKMRADYYFSDKPTDREPFKLSNDFTSRYARLLLEKHPEFEGVIRLRELETP